MTLYCWSTQALMMMMLSLLGMVVVVIPKGRKFYGLWLLLCPFQSTAAQTAAPNNWLEISNHGDDYDEGGDDGAGNDDDDNAAVLPLSTFWAWSERVPLHRTKTRATTSVSLRPVGRGDKNGRQAHAGLLVAHLAPPVHHLVQLADLIFAQICQQLDRTPIRQHHIETVQLLPKPTLMYRVIF